MISEHDGTPLQTYLTSLDTVCLNHTLNEVLTELRKRESEKIKKDVVTHTQSLRLKTRNASI